MPEYLLAIVSVGFVVFVTLFVGSFCTLALYTGVVHLMIRIYRDIFIGQPRQQQTHHHRAAIANRQDQKGISFEAL